MIWILQWILKRDTKTEATQENHIRTYQSLLLQTAY